MWDHSAPNEVNEGVRPMRSAITTMPVPAAVLKSPATIDMPVLPASSWDMCWEAKNARRLDEAIRQAERPAFSRDLLWEDAEMTCLSSAEATLSAEPLPEPPLKTKLPQPLVELVEGWPDLFPIVTPIDVDAFRQLLRTHPN